MERCLYEPGLGYYSSAQAKFGAAGDFVTAPMQSPLFGACVGLQCSQWLKQLGSNQIMEFGAGNGQLAAQILNELERQGLEVRYTIIELSADLQERQLATISAQAPQSLNLVQWQSQWPVGFSGVMLGNELIDAMPVKVFISHENSQLFERGVGINPNAAHGKVHQDFSFIWIDRPADELFSRELANALTPAGWTTPPIIYQSEIAPQASAWMRSAAACLDRGVILLIDYGFAASEYYHPQRSMGTLNCHYKHHAHGDPFFWPGLQDITAHVDFSALYGVAVAHGMELLGYTTQAHFLLSAGILQRLEILRSGSSDLQYAQSAQATGRLVSEAEMGELFKAIALAKLPKGMNFESIGFATSGTADRSASL